MKVKHLLILLLPLSTACGSGSDSDLDDIENQSPRSGEELGDNLKVFMLPSPLQVASAIRIFDMEYYEKLLSPTNTSTANYPTAYLKSLNMGIYGIDMGYTTIYERKQDAIHYLSNIEKLAQELQIINAFKTETVKRFENNISNQDSLYQIILQSFSSAHKYLQDNDREHIGLLVISGSFIEGLYLITQLTEKKKTRKVLNLIAQQKIYLENLIELLGRFESQEDIAGLISKFNGLNELFKGIHINYSENGEITKDVAITNEQLEAIKERVKTIRDEIVG